MDEIGAILVGHRVEHATKKAPPKTTTTPAPQGFDDFFKQLACHEANSSKKEPIGNLILSQGLADNRELLMDGNVSDDTKNLDIYLANDDKEAFQLQVHIDFVKTTESYVQMKAGKQNPQQYLITHKDDRKFEVVITRKTFKHDEAELNFKVQTGTTGSKQFNFFLQPDNVKTDLHRLRVIPDNGNVQLILLQGC